MPTLDWLNRDAAFRIAHQVPYRMLEPVSAHGDGDVRNLLVQGDNLDALKALLPLYRGQVKCIFIDPPYNTKSAFEHYDDNLEHSQWLTMMLPRLQLLREFLREDGSIWVTIDDNEGHYLKVLMDEVFGRSCFVDAVIWQKADSPRNSARQFSSDHDYMFVYSLQPDWVPTRLERTEEANSIYSNPDNDERGPWLPGDPYANKPYSRGQYSIAGPTGRTFAPPPGRFWRVSEEKLREPTLRVAYGGDLLAMRDPASSAICRRSATSCRERSGAKTMLGATERLRTKCGRSSRTLHRSPLRSRSAW